MQTDALIVTTVVITLTSVAGIALIALLIKEWLGWRSINNSFFEIFGTSLNGVAPAYTLEEETEYYMLVRKPK